MNVVWFKRDLRVTDHKALASAAGNGTIVPLYILEPELWKQPDVSCRHFDFLKECLISLRRDLQSHGLNLVIKVGDAVEVPVATIKNERAKENRGSSKSYNPPLAMFSVRSSGRHSRKRSRSRETTRKQRPRDATNQGQKANAINQT